MNKLTKVGFSALCGSLAAVSAANAGDMTVTGGADMTWVSHSGRVTGNPVGIGSNLSFKGSGELDNGWTYDLTIANTNLTAYSATNLTITMGGLGKFNINQGDSGNGIAAIDDKMPTAWEESWGAGLSTGVRLPLGSGASSNVMYTTPTLLGTTLTFTYAPQYGITDQSDKTTATNNGIRGSAYDGTININPSLGTEILAGLNIFGGASTMEAHGGEADKYEAVGGLTYSLGPISLGWQVSGDYTGIDSKGTTGGSAVYNFYKANAFGISFNVNDNLSFSYGEWEGRKSGYTDSETVQPSEDGKTIRVDSVQVAYTMGGASIRIAESSVDNAAWAIGDNSDATTVSLGLAF